MRYVVFGANGGTGRVLCQQAVDAGHDVVAVTRDAARFPLSDPRLLVAEADVHDRAAVTRIVGGADAVLSTLGVPFGRREITVYSEGIDNIATAMRRHGVRRVVAVSSSAAYPTRHADGGFLLNRVMQPLLTATMGRTTYRDMRAMEEFLRTSGLDWTVLRPGGLFDAPEPTAYELQEDHSDRIFTSRADLAASMLALAGDDKWVGRCVAVNTTEGAPTLLGMMRREAFSRG
ncbi:NAD-dependent epimerase [Frankia sp. CcI49]|uniref:NAD(P)-dependent oxidoreductase n=1 Tax=unclassified Frankia TaxID=2632575 RepID=UPI0006CA203F|nr:MULTISPECIES: NAD(P)H-binding protein [unclassified Frankia]KPM54058.1 NAD-dependent epimerase [Frankia sp. R43]ONH61474.1 NAD-dependent epimerase [Frankia sp. CcI49]